LNRAGNRRSWRRIASRIKDFRFSKYYNPALFRGVFSGVAYSIHFQAFAVQKGDDATVVGKLNAFFWKLNHHGLTAIRNIRKRHFILVPIRQLLAA
jgi:hypothetical protein